MPFEPPERVKIDVLMPTTVPPGSGNASSDHASDWKQQNDHAANITFCFSMLSESIGTMCGVTWFSSSIGGWRLVSRLYCQNGPNSLGIRSHRSNGHAARADRFFAQKKKMKFSPHNLSKPYLKMTILGRDTHEYRNSPQSPLCTRVARGMGGRCVYGYIEGITAGAFEKFPDILHISPGG